MPFYMKAEDISGSVSKKYHEGWIKLNALDFGLSRQIDTQPGNTQNREELLAQISEIVISKPMDRSSPKLFDGGCRGHCLGTIIIHACRTANASDEYLEYIVPAVESSGNYLLM